MTFFVEAKIVAINYASHQLTLRKKTVYWLKLPHMVKMYNQLPNLGQMERIRCIVI
jgi:hypothetical protein